MHGSLLDSHHRSSLSSSGPGALSSSEHTLAGAGEDVGGRFSRLPSVNSEHPSVPSVPIDMNNSSVLIVTTGEDADDDKEPTEPVTHTADFFRWTRGHRRVMLTFCTICLFAFMTGVEYAVILPTAFDYVKTLTNANIYVGLILSSYSISGSIAGIIMGKISDVTGKVKLLILISNVFEIVGNILYFVTNNIHIVLLGRLIAGVGMGAVPPILADVAHRTTEVDRTKAISIILGCRQFGLLIGPCFTLIIRTMNFHIGSVHVNHLNGPGFLMATVWLVLQIVCWFCFYDRTPSTTIGPTPSNGHSPKHKYTRSDHPSPQQQQKLSAKIYREHYCRPEMLVLFLTTFITYFNQTALETIVAAFTEKHFKWNTVHTSILFAFAGLEIILAYVLLVKFCSKRFEDRMMLIFGFVSLTLACTLGAFFTWALPSFGWTGYNNAGINKRLLAMFIIFVFLDLLGLPFVAATSVSLFTKLTIKELQGFSQGTQRLVMGVGTIVGPLFAAPLLNQLHIMMTTMLSLTLLTLIAIFFVLKRLRPRSTLTPKAPIESKDANNNNNHHSSSIEDDSDEPASALALSSKNCYVALVQQDDEPHQLLLNGHSNRNSLTKRLPSTSNSNSNDGPHTPTNTSMKFDTSSTNVLYLSDEQQRTVDDTLPLSSNRILVT